MHRCPHFRIPLGVVAQFVVGGGHLSVRTTYLVAVIIYANPASFGPGVPSVQMTSPSCAKNPPTSHNPSVPQSYKFYHKKSLTPSFIN